jgi:hypothetical protein
VGVVIGGDHIWNSDKSSMADSAENARALQDYWTDLQNIVQAKLGQITDSICCDIARKILNECFRESHFPKASLLWWFERSVMEMRDRVFSHSHVEGQRHHLLLTPLSIQGIHDAVINSGHAARIALCSDSERSAEVKQHAAAFLRRQRDVDKPTSSSKVALEAILDMSEEAFMELFKERVHILLQAAAVVLCFLRIDMPGVKRCVLPSFHDFLVRYTDVTIRDGSKMLATCSVVEKQTLYFTCNMMRIAALFIPAQRGKGKHKIGSNF